jgi:hypothetical protein
MGFPFGLMDNRPKGLENRRKISPVRSKGFLRLTYALIFGKLILGKDEFPTLALAPVSSPLSLAGFLLSGGCVPFRTVERRANRSQTARSVQQNFGLFKPRRATSGEIPPRCRSSRCRKKI